MRWCCLQTIGLKGLKHYYTGSSRGKQERGSKTKNGERGPLVRSFAPCLFVISRQFGRSTEHRGFIEVGGNVDEIQVRLLPWKALLGELIHISLCQQGSLLVLSYLSLSHAL